MVELIKLLLVGSPQRTGALHDVIERSSDASRLKIQTSPGIHKNNRELFGSYHVSDPEFIRILLTGYTPTGSSGLWVPDLAVVPAGTFDKEPLNNFSSKSPILIDHPGHLYGHHPEHYLKSPIPDNSDAKLFALYGVVMNAIKNTS